MRNILLGRLFCKRESAVKSTGIFMPDEFRQTAGDQARLP
jgi:hypothetical protein